MQHLEEMVNATEQIWNPPRARSDLDYLEAREVHVSSLIKKTAVEIYNEIRQIGSFEEPENYWGWSGDAINFALSPDFPLREIQVTVPLENGWKMAGTIDWLRLTPNNTLIVGESKFNRYPRVGFHDEMAFRQASLYAAMLNDAYSRGERHFKASDDEYRYINAILDRLAARGISVERQITAPKLDFVAPEGMRLEGVLIRIASAFPDGKMAKGFVLGKSQFEEFLNHYFTKARIIARCVEAEDVRGCESFDKQNATELIRTFDKIKEPPIEAKALFLELYEVRKTYNGARYRQEEINSELAYSMVKGEIEEGTYALNENGFTAVVSMPSRREQMHPKVTFRGRPEDKQVTE